MFRISSFSFTIYVILCSYGTQRSVATEELPTSIDAGDIDVQASDAVVSLNQGQETLADHSQDVLTLLQKSDSPVVTNTEQAPSTPASSQHTATLDTDGAGAPVATEPERKDAGIVDSTISNGDLSSQSLGLDASPETGAVQNDENTGQVKQVSPQDGALENRPVGLDEETAISTEPDPVLSAATDAEPITASYQPDINQLLEQMQHTQIEAAATDSLSHYLPSSEENVYRFDTPVPTETRRLDSPGTWEPTVVGKVTVKPHVVDEVVVTTQFSLDEDEEKLNNGEEEFPTFDKWSMQYLAEQEKHKKQDQLFSASTLLLQKKLRQNYAAASCGAKVVASNPEAENVQYLLNRNPDEYMISPCKAKKWFVVELCEPVQIHKVELGSLEMFSSPPKSFRVFASQRYPTKEWISVGTFDMIPERSIQSFTSQPSEEFVKFVRVELLEHYGDEHYCPVSTFRVMGVDMTSEDDDEAVNEVEEADEETFGEAEDEDVEESVNLFTSAKEIMLKLMRKVLYTEDHQHVEEGKDKPPTEGNITVTAEGQKAKDASCSDKGLPSYAEMPTVHIPEAGIISPPPGPSEPEEVPIVTKLADTEQLPTVTIETPVVIKLGEDAENRPWELAVYNMPDHCVLVDWSKFLHIMAFSHMLYSTCPARPPVLRENRKSSCTTDMGSPVTGEVIEDATAPQAGASEDGTVVADTSASWQAETQVRSTPGIQELHHRGSGQAPPEPQPVSSSENSATVVPATDLQQKDSEAVVQRSEATSFLSSGVSVTRSEELEPSSLLSHQDTDCVNLSLMTPDLHLQQSQLVEQGTASLAQTIFLKVSPSPTLTSEDSMDPGEDMKPQVPTAEQHTDFHVDEHMSKPAFDASFTQLSEGPDLEAVADEIKGQMLEKNETGSSGGKTGKSVDLVKVGLSSTSKRDTSIMKLSSRIMALEQNVSMAKRYLEELSRAFKQQNEDMMKLLNKTEKKLNIYVSQSEERELKQQTQTDVLQQQVINLSQLVDTMQLQMNALGKELRDAQLLLAFVQVVLFLWLMITSVRGRGKSPLVYTDHQFLLDTMPTKPTIERSDKNNLHRRNSDLGVHCGLQPAMSALKRQVSEANLASFGGNKQLHSVDDQSKFVPDTYQVPKKRKKRKLKQPHLSVDSISSLSATSNSAIPAAQSASFSSYAGVLFGTDSSYTPAQNSGVQEPYRLSKDTLVSKSTSQTLNSLTENHNGLSACSLAGCELGCPYKHVISDCLHARALLSDVRIQDIGSAVVASNPSLIAPTLESVPITSLIAPTLDNVPSTSLIVPTLCSVPSPSLKTPTLGSVPSTSLIAPKLESVPITSLIAPTLGNVPSTSPIVPTLFSVPSPSLKTPTLGSFPSTSLKAPTLGSIPSTFLIAPTLGSVPSTSLIAPTLGSVPNTSLIAPTLCSAPSTSMVAPTLGSVPRTFMVAPTLGSVLVSSKHGLDLGADRISSVGLRENLQTFDLPGAPQTCVAAPSLSESTSLEIPAPVHHRTEVKTLMENKCSHNSDCVTSKATGFSGAENCVCEHCFKFPLSMPLVECGCALKKAVSVGDETAIEWKCPATVFINLKQHSWIPPDHYRSTSALSTSSLDSTSSGKCSSEPLPHRPSLMPLYDTSQFPVVVGANKPRSLSQLSSTSLLAAGHRQPASPHCHCATPTRDVSAVVSQGIEVSQNVAKYGANSAMTGRAHDVVVDGVSKSLNTSHNHRRQRSLPLHSLRASKSSEKTAHGQPSSSEDEKLQVKLSSASLQTSSRMRRISAFSKHKTGGSLQCVDSSSNLSCKKKGSI